MWKHPAWWASPGSLCDFRLIFSPFSFREMSCFQLGFATCTHHLDDDGISHASGWMYANLCLSNIIVIVANINSHNGLCLKLNHIYTKSLWPALVCWCALNTEHWTQRNNNGPNEILSSAANALWRITLFQRAVHVSFCWPKLQIMDKICCWFIV